MYYTKARLLPTILTGIPILILLNYVTVNIFYAELKLILNVLPILTSLGLSTGIIFLSVQINRLIAKEIFQNLFFKSELNMPTTNHLLWKDTFFDIMIKTKIRSKINEKFGITLITEQEESENELKSRNQIVTSVSQIRNVLRENKLVLQHNIEYGFFRNFVGGSVIAVISAIVLFIYSNTLDDQTMKTTAIILFSIYIIPILLSKYLMKRFGNYYSKILYEQFLTI